ncbi:integrase/recombinase XerC [Bacillus thermophilus]|uniref:Integrase/recombinase XerC n=1 Tax=Siminovitchia thermophila TaxID=1245522 RepID=A0ABS2R6Q8_9BACI|nr:MULTISPECIES: site-specific integrase [Siminovitchia]MBM7715345.1 integrase/recombinase XerC [Siminovitchia thermophila]
MIKNGNVVFTRDFENRKRHAEQEQKLKEVEKRIPPGYRSEIRMYQKYCKETRQLETIESLMDFLFVSITEEAVKKNTWEKRVVALRKYFSVTYDISFDEEIRKTVANIRKLYQEDDRKRLKKETGKLPVDLDELLNIIDILDTRAKAICLVNLDTANRPNEMVNLKIQDFQLDGRIVNVFLQKQDKWHNKRLQPGTVRAVQEYIKEYGLQPQDYFIGRRSKGGNFEGVKISETAYRKQLKKWTGYTPYNFRKTMVAFMHSAGADLSTIAKQTGHRSLETLDKHYLNVADATVDKFMDYKK